MSCTIRPAGPADLAAVEAIVEAAYSPYIARMGTRPGPMLDDYAALTAAGRLEVAEVAGAVAGILVCFPEADHLLLDNIAVAPAAQGAGVGRALMQHAEAHARALGLPEIRLYTNVLMTENIALYLRIGFTETHRVVEKGFSRVYMARALPPASPSA